MFEIAGTTRTTDLINANPLENPSISLRDPKVWQAIFGGGMTDSGVNVTPRTALGYAPLWRAINLVAGDVAKLPCHVFRRLPDGGKERDRRHPAWSLLTLRASMKHDAMTFRETLIAHALLRGNGYAAIARNNRGEPMELLVLNPADTFPLMVDGDLWYITQVEGEQIRIRQENMFHVRGLSDDGISGMDIITLMAESLGVGMAAQNFGAKFFGSGANVSGILMVPGHYSDEKVRNTIEAWNEMATGLSEAHKIALLQDGVKFQPMTVNPEQAQFLQTRQHEVRVVANIIGCPPHKLGDETRTSFSSLESENQSYLDECLDRWLKKFELECCLKLLSQTQKDSDSHFIEFNRNALLRMSAKDRAEFYAKLQEHGDMTVNDVLRRENMPTIGEQGDRRYRPGNLVEIGPEPDSNQPAEPPEPPETPEETPEDRSRLLSNLVETSVTKSLVYECGSLVKAAGRERDFAKWLDKYYTRWISNSSCTPEMQAEFTVHAAESKRQMLEVMSCTVPDTLQGAVEECVATWTDRGAILTRRILNHG